MTRVFLDLDGVMADFDGDFERRIGMSPADYCDTYGDDSMWNRINGFDRFFANLPPCEGALDAYRQMLEVCTPIILTACPRTDYKGVAMQKMAWVRKWLGSSVMVLPTMGGTSKPRFMQHPGDILIDDFERNTKAWKEAGGFPILHRGDWTNTLQELDWALV